MIIAVYSGNALERKLENNIAREVCLTVREKHKSATCTWYIFFNKFALSWETQVPWKTAFVTFSVSGVNYQTVGGAFPAEGEQGKKAAEFVQWSLCGELFMRPPVVLKLALLEYFFRFSLFRIMSTAQLWLVCLELRKRNSTWSSSWFLNTPARSCRCSQGRLIPVVWPTGALPQSVLSRSTANMCFVVACWSLKEFLLDKCQKHLIWCWRRTSGHDAETALFAINWKRSTTEEKTLSPKQLSVAIILLKYCLKMLCQTAKKTKNKLKQTVQQDVFPLCPSIWSSRLLCPTWSPFCSSHVFKEGC